MLMIIFKTAAQIFGITAALQFLGNHTKCNYWHNTNCYANYKC